MFNLLFKWYKRRFSDPQAIALLVILIIGFCIIYFFSHILAPLLIAIVLAYLLEWPTQRLIHIGLSRSLASTLVVIFFCSFVIMGLFTVFPVAWQQGVNFSEDIPDMLNHFYTLASSLPKHYPNLLSVNLIDVMVENLRSKVPILTDSLVKFSMASVIGMFTWLVYIIIVPMMVFFLLKDKSMVQQAFLKVLPRDRGLASQIWIELNQQIMNYIRGKVVEIFVMAVASYVIFFIFDLQYSLLLAVLVGFSSIVPYIGTIVVSIPVAIVALFQWGITSDFWWVFCCYLVLQTLDGNLLVPLLFSGVVNIHPFILILSVVVFGGLWGFWGVFFAIPLATLINSSMRAWPETLSEEEKNNALD